MVLGDLSRSRGSSFWLKSRPSTFQILLVICRRTRSFIPSWVSNWLLLKLPVFGQTAVKVIDPVKIIVLFVLSNLFYPFVLRYNYIYLFIYHLFTPSSPSRSNILRLIIYVFFDNKIFPIGTCHYNTRMWKKDIKRAKSKYFIRICRKHFCEC